MDTELSDMEVLPGFIVFEGLDGAGTTTQATQLAAHLEKTRRAEFTCEPTDMPTGRVIRSLLARSASVDPKTMAYLFAADRNEHLYNRDHGILRKVSDGLVVVCDRYVFSSLAYQGSEVAYDLVESLNGRFPLPEHLVFIDVSVQTAEDRRRTRLLTEERYEHREFQDRVYARYQSLLDLYARSAMKIHRIDGRGTPETVHQRVVESVAL